MSFISKAILPLNICIEMKLRIISVFLLLIIISAVHEEDEGTRRLN